MWLLENQNSTLTLTVEYSETTSSEMKCLPDKWTIAEFVFQPFTLII